MAASKKGNGKIERDPRTLFTVQERIFLWKALQAEEAGILSEEGFMVVRRLLKRVEDAQMKVSGQMSGPGGSVDEE